MVFRYANHVKVTTPTVGQGTLTLGAPVTRYRSFPAGGYADGDTCRYVIEDGNDWEIGTGTYSAGTLARSAFLASSTGTWISCSGNATVMVDITAEDFTPAGIGATPDMAVGTPMLFWMTTPPPGWVKTTNTGWNDRALRIVNGAASYGGSYGYSTVFGRTVTDAFYMDATYMTAHAHSMSDTSGLASANHSHVFQRVLATTGNDYTAGGTVGAAETLTGAVASSGDSVAHTHVWSAVSGAASWSSTHQHGIEMRVAYVDVIYATRDNPAPTVKLANRARQFTATVGQGTLALGAAMPRYRTFAAAGVADGNSVHYVIEDGSNWELGTGVLGGGGTTLTRTLIQSSTGALLSLTGNANVRVDILGVDINAAQAGSLPNMNGALMVFMQTTPPVAWTKNTGANDYLLRCNGTGTGGTSGGAVLFSTVFGSRTATDAINADLVSHIHNFTDTTNSQSANHSHTYQHASANEQGTNNGAGNFPRVETAGIVSGGASATHTHAVSATSSTYGSSALHSHPIDMRVQYVDVVLASKDAE